MNIETVATIIAVSIGVGLTVGLTIGLLVAKNGVVANVCVGIRDWNTSRVSRKARRNDPYRQCLHVVIDDQGHVVDYFEHLPGFGMMSSNVWQCQLCGHRKGWREYGVWHSVVLPDLCSKPDKVRNRLASIEQLIRKQESL